MVEGQESHKGRGCVHFLSDSLVQLVMLILCLSKAPRAARSVLVPSHRLSSHLIQEPSPRRQTSLTRTLSEGTEPH